MLKLINMTNVTTSFDASKIMGEISKFAPFALLICALFSFVAVSIFTVDYYEHLFLKRFSENAKFMAIVVAVIQEAVRFGLLVTSIKDFSDKKPFNGWLGLVGSIILVAHDISIAKDISSLWSPENPSPYSGILIFLILIGLLLEIRLILTLSGTTEDKNTKRKKSFSQNGKSAKTADVQWLND
jgi:hypothetical protein